jgi:hypothetical protein
MGGAANTMSEANARDLLFVVRAIISSLPLKRDWLDPTVEALAKRRSQRLKAVKTSPGRHAPSVGITRRSGADPRKSGKQQKEKLAMRLSRILIDAADQPAAVFSTIGLLAVLGFIGLVLAILVLYVVVNNMPQNVRRQA